jgi:hypothetical protein
MCPLKPTSQLIACPLPLDSTEAEAEFFRSSLASACRPAYEHQVNSFMGCDYNIELSIRRDKSVQRPDQSDAERPYSVKMLLHASLIASIFTALLAHIHNLQTRPSHEGSQLTEAPLHPRHLALQLVVSGHSIARAFDLKGPRRSGAGSRVPICSRMPGETPTGVGGPPSWTSSVAGNFNLSRANRPATEIYRRRLKWTRMGDQHWTIPKW